MNLLSEISIETAHEFMYDNVYSILRRETLNKPKQQINSKNGFSIGSIGEKISEVFTYLNPSCSSVSCCQQNI